MTFMRKGIFIVCAVLFFLGRTTTAAPSQVTLVRTPNGGIQPQASVDNQGTIHLIYYGEDESAGNIYYVRRAVKDENFSKPIRVNSQTGSAISVGSIRGAQLAVGKNGRVHVAWDGMGKGATRVNIAGVDVTPLLYTRLNDAGTAFEPERNVITYAPGLDGGSAVAADAQGNVYVAWHGRAPGSKEGEAGRAVFIARSTDDGKSFSRETPATSKLLGACACCGMRAFADSRGAVYIIFRAATGGSERGETLLMSPRPGAEFQVAYTHPWQATICPMSSATLTETANGVVAAWETGNDVFFASIDRKTSKVSPPTGQSAGAKRKHPVAVTNSKGQTLFVWTEGTGWKKGGSFAWQVYGESGKPLEEQGKSEGVPVWGLVSAVAKPDGDFIIFY